MPLLLLPALMMIRKSCACPPRRPFRLYKAGHLLLLLAFMLAACQPPVESHDVAVLAIPAQAQPNSPDQETQPTLTPLPGRPRYAPGELVDYVAQSGDTLPMLALRFNTTVAEILEANPFIPADATTMPPGMPMKIPIYYLPLWGAQYRILPDSYFINGPVQIGFNTEQYVASQPGWLKDYKTYAADQNRTGAQVVDYLANNYSLSPRLLLALLEYQAGALSQPTLTPEQEKYLLGYQSWSHPGLFLQLSWAANLLNNGYYDYKNMKLTEIEYRDGRIEHFDPWQNAATAALHNYFNTLDDYDVFRQAISPDGFAKTYADLFGDPWQNEQPHIPGSLTQPEFILPFQPGDIWALTGGPHTGWGTGEPFAALDFAPPSKTSGCVPSDIWATAVADGVVVRSITGEVMLDLDGDGDEHTGWDIFYMHLGTQGRAPVGAKLKQGDPIGHPSCEGGAATGTHVHIARKYNGEWIPAAGTGGVLPFNLEGWIAHNGSQPYLGTLTRNSRVVTACTCSNAASFIQSDRPK
jgi:LasA protease